MLAANHTYTHKLQELEKALLEEWDRIPQLVINSLIDSMPQSDESQFCISDNQSSAYVRRRTHDEFSPQCLKPTVKYPTKVMVWGSMSSHGVGRLHIVRGTMKAMNYIEILQNKLLPTARYLFRNQSWVFQDDNAPCHRAKVVQK
ncbi:transposable element Tcb1 transposase [Trichonephila clavipes]|nr:transposable element Tcb1 transposase [Trichonephila clavipes]